MRAHHRLAPLLLLCACATTGPSGLAGKYDRLAEQLEAAQPNAAELDAGKLTEVRRVLRTMEAALDASSIDALDPAQRASFVARVKAARRRYRIATAQRLADPSLASGVLLPESDAPDVWAALLDVVGRLEASRQSEYAAQRTYKRTRNVVNERSSMTIVNGQVVDNYKSVSAGGVQANCAFASAPFPPEGRPNPSLRYHFEGAAPHIYARCYAPGRDLSRLPPGHLMASIPAPNRNVIIDLGAPARLAPGTAALDFEIGPSEIQRALASDRGVLDVELIHVSAPDNIVVVQNGALRVRPDWHTRVLGSSSFLVDRGAVDGSRANKE